MSIYSKKLLQSSSLSLDIKGIHMQLKCNVVHSKYKIYCTYIISVAMGGVGCINRLKLNRSQVTLYSFFLYTNEAHK